MLGDAHGGKRLPQAVLEEMLGFGLAATEAIRRGNQFLRLWHQHCTEQSGIDGTECSADPDVEKVREVSITDVVVVGWIG